MQLMIFWALIYFITIYMLTVYICSNIALDCTIVFDKTTFKRKIVQWAKILAGCSFQIAIRDNLAAVR
jgi:hypothetical protein